MYKKTKKYSKGFTLVELIVVLVILAILIALLVPALTGYIDKANQKAAMTECRQVVVATQTTASSLYGKDEFSEAEMYKLTDDILKLAEVDGNIDYWEFNNENAAVTVLIYTSRKNITVQYKDKKYTILESGYLMGTAKGLTTLSNQLAKDNNFTFVSGDYKTTQALQKKLMEKNGGKLPNLNSNEKAILKSYDFVDDKLDVDKIVWKPFYDKNGEIYLAADFKGNNAVGQASSGLIYYQGTYYVHRNGYNRYDTTSISDRGAEIDISESSRWEAASLG